MNGGNLILPLKKSIDWYLNQPTNWNSLLNYIMIVGKDFSVPENIDLAPIVQVSRIVTVEHWNQTIKMVNPDESFYVNFVVKDSSIVRMIRGGDIQVKVISQVSTQNNELDSQDLLFTSPVLTVLDPYINYPRRIIHEINKLKINYPPNGSQEQPSSIITFSPVFFHAEMR